MPHHDMVDKVLLPLHVSSGSNLCERWFTLSKFTSYPKTCEYRDALVA